MTRHVRERLPDTRSGHTRKIVIGDVDVYVRTGEYEDGRLGELFVLAGRPGETVQGLLDAVGIAVSIGLQYGIPIDVFCDKFEHTQFPPWQTGVASSPLDAIFRHLRERYGKAPTEPVEVETEAEVKSAPTHPERWERCYGDGEHGCGHAVHEGPCTARFVGNGIVQCMCRGSRAVLAGESADGEDVKR